MIHPACTYFICTSPRSGSEMLCNALTCSRLGGWPGEWLQESHFGSLFDELGATTFSEYLPRVVETRTRRGVFGVKVMGGVFFRQTLARLHELPAYANKVLPPHELLADLFPAIRYVWLTRRDKVRQAVSWSKALQTNTWQSHVATQPVTNAPTYDFAAIDLLVQRLVLQDSAWQTFFSQAGVRPLTLVYEELSQSPEAAVRQVLDYLKIPLPGDWTLVKTNPGPEKLADGTSEKWVNAYLEQKQTRVAIDVDNLPIENRRDYNAWLTAEHRLGIHPPPSPEGGSG